ncbi:GtrA family protein [Priestia abyssalis]|uniref:GtrA family protein n=1 Tax=Priestia abyssalis TaxID=1221450 RepID=UPI001472A3FD|nr:GtrA family protein [Priestia abyssalis]
MRIIKEKVNVLLRFCTVGVGNTLIDFGVFFLLTAGGIPYLFAQGCSYAAGMVNSYVWNRVWTFQVKQKANMQEAVRFAIVNIGASSMTFLILYILQEGAGLSLVVSKVIATIGGILITFIGSRLWVFQERINKRSES